MLKFLNMELEYIHHSKFEYHTECGQSHNSTVP